MKKLTIFLVFVLWGKSLPAQEMVVDSLLQIIETRQINRVVVFKMEDVKWNPNKITRRVTAKQVLAKIQREKQNVVIKNCEITGSIKLDSLCCQVSRLIFLNCRFRNDLLLDQPKIANHLAFLACRLKGNLILRDFSTKHLSFLSNVLENKMAYNAFYRKNRVDQFLFIGNQFQHVAFNAYSIYTSSDFLGKLDTHDLFLIGNRGATILFSGIGVEELFYFSGNLVRRLELSNQKSNSFSSCQFSHIDTCIVQYIQEGTRPSVFFGRNEITNLKLNSNKLEYCILRYNKLRKVEIVGMVVDLSLQLDENLHENPGEIFLRKSRIALFSFTNQADSIVTCRFDTVRIADSNSAARSDSGMAIHVGLPEPDREVQIRTEVVRKSPAHQTYSLNVDNTSINENNWRVQFETVAKYGDVYRLNPSDSSLARRHELYTAIHNAYARQGKWEQADACYYEWKQLERSKYFELSNEVFFIKLAKSIFNSLNWISCGYGIKPLRIFPFAFLVVLVFALFYFFTPQPISNLEHHLISSEQLKEKLSELSSEDLQKQFKEYDFDFEKHKQDLIDDIISSIGKQKLTALLEIKPLSHFSLNYFWNCFYFSFSTFSTVGLGDWYPTGNLNRTIVMIEGALGWLSLGLFITTYANVLLR